MPYSRNECEGTFTNEAPESSRLETVATYYRRITIGLLNRRRGSARRMRALFAVNIDLSRIDSGKQLSNLHNPIAPNGIKKKTSFVEVTEGKQKKYDSESILFFQQTCVSCLSIHFSIEQCVPLLIPFNYN